MKLALALLSVLSVTDAQLPDVGAVASGGASGDTGTDGTATPTVTVSTATTTTPDKPSRFDWDGVSMVQTCGTHIDLDQNIVNKTCTFTYDEGDIVPNVFRFFVGGGPFIVPDADGAYKITGYHGITTEKRITATIFWEMMEDSNDNLLNTTCGSEEFVALSCDDGTEPLKGLYFMENINAHMNAQGSNYAFQVAGAEADQILNIQLKDSLDAAFSCIDFSTNMGDVVLDAAPNCHEVTDTSTGEVKVNCPNGQIQLTMKTDETDKPFTGGLVVFHCTQNEENKEPNMWYSTVAGEASDSSTGGDDSSTGGADSSSTGASGNRKRRNARKRRTLF